MEDVVFVQVLDALRHPETKLVQLRIAQCPYNDVRTLSTNKNKILITIRPDELFERSFRVELYDERFGATDIDIALVVFEFEIVAITDESENI